MYVPLCGPDYGLVKYSTPDIGASLDGGIKMSHLLKNFFWKKARSFGNFLTFSGFLVSC